MSTQFMLFWLVTTRIIRLRPGPGGNGRKMSVGSLHTGITTTCCQGSLAGMPCTSAVHGSAYSRRYLSTFGEEPAALNEAPGATADL